MSISEKDLRRLAPTIVESDRPCVNCGYSLRGLKVDGVCPECGHAIKPGKAAARFSGQLVNAPLPWLNGFAAGAVQMFLAALGVVVLVVVMLFHRSVVMVVITGLVTLAWYGGIWLTTRPRPVLPTTQVDTRREWSGLRLASRLTQACWPMSCMAVLGAIAVYNAGLSSAVLWGSVAFAGLLALVAIAGLAPLCTLLAHTADWAEDTSLAQSFRGCAWTVCFCAAVIGLALLNGFTGFLGGLIGGLLASTIIAMVFLPPAYFLWSLFRLQHMARWAVWNHVAAEARLDRFRARAEANAAMPRPEPDRPRSRRG